MTSALWPADHSTQSLQTILRINLDSTFWIGYFPIVSRVSGQTISKAIKPNKKHAGRFFNRPTCFLWILRRKICGLFDCL